METVGEILRGQREKKGLSLKDVEAATSIRALYLKSIEDGSYKIIPGEVYLKGFIRNYAHYLELDGQEMVDLYRQSQLPPSVPMVSLPTSAAPAAPSGIAAGKWLFIGLIMVGIAGGAWWFLDASSPQSPGLRVENKPTPTAPAQPVKPPVSTQTPAPANSDTKKPTKPVVITAKFTAQCWTLIVVDGKDTYEGIPKNGETMTWEAQQNIVITLGNASAVELVFNGQNIGKLGGQGEVITKNFSVNAAKKP